MMSIDPWYSFMGVRVEGFIKAEGERLMNEKK